MSEEQNVFNVVEEMTTAFQTQNMAGVLASYEEDAAVIFEPGNKAMGKDVLENNFKAWFSLNPEFDYPNGHEVYIAGDIALHIAPWQMSATAPDGTELKQSGLSVAVLRKQENGAWLMVLDNPHGQRLVQN